MSTRRRRARQEAQHNAEAEQPQGQQVDMQELLTAMTGLGQRNSRKYKAPKFGGEGDLDLFLLQFNDVADANDWNDMDRLLNLRASLEGSAATCGRKGTVEEILANLRARYGLTEKQALDKLSVIRKPAKQSFHEYADEVTKLVATAYPDQDGEFLEKQSLQYFKRSLSNKTLQHQFSARAHHTLAEAVTIAEEFCQVEGIKPTLTQLDMLSDEEGEGAPVINHTATKAVESASANTQIQALIDTMKQFVEGQANLQKQITGLTQNKGRQPQRRGPCYFCGGGHLRRECEKYKQHVAAGSPAAGATPTANLAITSPTTAPFPTQAAGNGPSPTM